MPERLRIGVVGLDRSWAKIYRPALLAVRDRFVVCAVADPCPRRAADAAREAGCAPAPGILALLDMDVDAVLLLGRPWYRLWPLEQACRLGRPVYLGTSLAADALKADDVVRQVRVANLPVMAELLPRLAPTTDRLRALLPKLGPLRSVVCTAERRGGGATGALAAGLTLVDWCTAFLDRSPTSVQGFERTAGHAGWLLDFDGTIAQIATWPGNRRSIRIRLIGARGAAEAILPRRLRWRIGRTRHAVDLPAGPPLVQMALEQFHAALTAGRPPAPGLDDAFHALTRLRPVRGIDR